MLKTYKNPVISTMRKDPKYKRLKETFSTHETFRLPLDDLMLELTGLHRSRKVRILNPTDPEFVAKVVESVLNDQAIRSRTTEILIRCVRAHALLSHSVEGLKYHLLTTYADSLKTYRTKDERAQIVNSTLRTFEKFLSDVLTLKESAQLVVNDIDKASWSLKSVLSALELHMAPERRI